MWLFDTNALIKIAKLQKKTFIQKGVCFTTILNIIEFPPSVEYQNLTTFFPTQDNYQESILLAAKMRSAGTGIKAIDLIIAIMAMEKGLTVISDDSDFRTIQSIDDHLKVMDFETYSDLHLPKSLKKK
jgi:predicted nucleic acid-binding protein